MAEAHLLRQLEDDMRAKVSSGQAVADATEKARDAFQEWLVSDFEEAKVYSAEELDLRRALRMEA